LNGGSKKEKEPKKKERGGPWNLPHLRKSVKVAFGNICLTIFTAAWKTLTGFSTATTDPAAVTTTDN